jgi:uncharacterized delta-60 repeat protein
MKFIILMLLISNAFVGCSGGGSGGSSSSKKKVDCDFGGSSSDKVNFVDSSFGDEGSKKIIHNDQDSSFSGIAFNSKCELFLLVDKGSGGFAIAKFDKNWKRISSFGDDGFVVGDVSEIYGDEVTGSYMRGQISIDKDGNIFLGAIGNAVGSNDLIVIKYKSSGVIDTSFGSNGISVTDFDSAGNDGISSVVPLDSGKILVLGQMSSSGAKMGAVRLNKNGSLDTSYGTDGKQIFIPDGATESTTYDEFVSNDGIYLAGGAAFAGTGYRCAIAKLDKNGELVDSWGTDGFALGDHDSGANEFDICYSLNEDEDGQLYAFGESNLGAIVMKVNGDSGDLDSSFNTTGVAYFDFGSGQDWAHRGAISKEGRVFVLSAATGWETDQGLTILNSAGAIDAEFDKNIGDDTISEYGAGQFVRDFGAADYISPALVVNVKNQMVMFSTSVIDAKKQIVITRFNVD